MFFFGRLHKRMVQPIDFLGPKMCQILQAKFPRPFEQYSTHLPSLTPYSILLQFVSIPTRARLRRWLPWSWDRTGGGTNPARPRGGPLALLGTALSI